MIVINIIKYDLEFLKIVVSEWKTLQKMMVKNSIDNYLNNIAYIYDEIKRLIFQ